MGRNANCYLSGSFTQYKRKFFTEGEGLQSRTILSVAIDNNNKVWVATDKGLSLESKKGFVPFTLDGLKEDEMVNHVFCDYDNTVWACAENILYEIKDETVVSVNKFPSDVVGIDCGIDGTKWLICTGELFKYEDGKWNLFLSGVSEGTYCSGATSIAAYENDTVYVGTPNSLLTLNGKRYHWRHLKSDKSDLLNDNISALKFDRWGHLWIGTEEGVCIYDNKNCWKDHRTLEALPAMKITCIDFDKKGGRYFGTDRGLIYYKNGKRRFFGPRIWIPDYNVNDVAVSDDGMKICVATDEGLSIICGEETTLLEKANVYQETQEKYHMRRDYCANRHLSEYEDIRSGSVGISDNDGLWTSCYIASQCFKYAVTGDEKAKENAKKSMKALIYLSEVSGIKGFPARAIRYEGEEGFGDGDKEWHQSPIDSCEWKGETSSDEMVGHFFAYATFYDLCADEEDKKAVAETVTNILDHIIGHRYHLCDVDGKPTTWASWWPDDLNINDKWVWERCVNSLEILAMLKAGYHITGNEKYNEEYEYFVKNHHYALNAAQHKMPDYHTCHIDENLGFLSSITLFRLEEDEDLRSLYMMGLKHLWKYEEVEGNPFWNLIYGALSGNECHLEESVQALRDFNIDLVKYNFDVSGRDDFEIDYSPELIGEKIQMKTAVPYMERTNYGGNPFDICIENGYRAEYPVVYLLPYWFARYNGLIIEDDNKD